MWQFLLDFLFPRRSLSGTEGQWITEEERIRLRSHPVIEEEGALRRRGLLSLDRLIAASTYADCPLLRKAIAAFKYGHIVTLDRELARLLLSAVPPSSVKDAVLCPVPLHWVRRFQRGFNQADRLAQIVADERGYAVSPLLKRRRWTGSQAKRGRSERLTAMEAAFACTQPHPPVRVILIDDVSTTGATLDQCALALKRAGVQRVEAWVIAHDQ